MVKRVCYEDVLPFSAMVAVECTNVGLNTIFKAAASKGMSRYVFVFYGYAIAFLILFPITIIFHRTRSLLVLPQFNFSLLCRIFLLGVIGFSAQILSYKGIEYSSPTLASAMSNLSLTFTFMPAIIFRMEVINLKSWSSGAKMIGTIVSISGALVVVLYKGPTIYFTTPSLASSSAQTNWVIGGLLLATAYLLYSIWYILQGCFGSCFSTVVHSWGLHLKGPVYLAIFRPLSIGIAAVMGVMFLGDALHLGSAVGVIIITIGFYAALWGKATEEEKGEEHGAGSVRSSSNSNTPLLQGYKVEQTEADSMGVQLYSNLIRTVYSICKSKMWQSLYKEIYVGLGLFCLLEWYWAWDWTGLFHGMVWRG